MVVAAAVVSLAVDWAETATAAMRGARRTEARILAVVCEGGVCW